MIKNKAKLLEIKIENCSKFKTEKVKNYLNLKWTKKY